MVGSSSCIQLQVRYVRRRRRLKIPTIIFFEQLIIIRSKYIKQLSRAQRLYIIMGNCLRVQFMFKIHY